jgi:hypothetical protein
VTAGDENILGLDVSMNYTLFVGITQCIRNFAKNLRRFLNWKLTSFCQSCPEIFSGDERHRVIEERAFGSSSKKRNDVRMLESRSELNLAPEPVDVNSGCEVRWKNLYDDLAIELGLGCNEDARHSRATELAVDSICGPEYFLKLELQVGCHGPEYSTLAAIPAS